MTCNHNDCFTCPYPDCVIGAKDACYSQEKRKERIQKRKEYQHQRYLMRKAMKEATAYNQKKDFYKEMG